MKKQGVGGQAGHVPAVSSSVPSQASACASEAQSGCRPLSLCALVVPRVRDGPVGIGTTSRKMQPGQNLLDVLALSPSPSSCLS